MHDEQPATLMAHLKSSTAEAHEAAEAVPFNAAVMSGRISLEAYTAQLHAYQVIYGTLQDLADAHDHPLIEHTWTGSDQPDRLGDDLKYLDPKATMRVPSAMNAATFLAHELSAMALSDGPQLFGAIYVLKGAGLGGLVMTRHLQRALGLRDQGLSFYGAQPQQRARNWKRFVQRANEFDLQPQHRASIVASARTVFDGVAQILWAISDHLAIGLSHDQAGTV